MEATLEMEKTKKAAKYLANTCIHIQSLRNPGWIPGKGHQRFCNRPNNVGECFLGADLTYIINTSIASWWPKLNKYIFGTLYPPFGQISRSLWWVGGYMRRGWPPPSKGRYAGFNISIWQPPDRPSKGTNLLGGQPISSKISSPSSPRTSDDAYRKFHLIWGGYNI